MFPAPTQFPLLVILAAPSGGGKTTFCQKMLADFSQKMILSISVTTRQPRPHEQEGKDYFFVSPAHFQKKIAEKKFAEWAQVHGHYYGTLHQTLQEAFRKKLSVLLPIDIQGAIQLQTHYPTQCLTIFLLPPNLKELENRLRRRETNTEESIQIRMRNAEHEIHESDQFTYRIQNDDLERAYCELKTILMPFLSPPFLT